MTYDLIRHTLKKSEVSLHCRTREGPIRTVSQIPMRLKVLCYQILPIHEVLRGLIGLRFGIDRKTVTKGLLF